MWKKKHNLTKSSQPIFISFDWISRLQRQPFLIPYKPLFQTLRYNTDALIFWACDFTGFYIPPELENGYLDR